MEYGQCWLLCPRFANCSALLQNCSHFIADKANILPISLCGSVFVFSPRSGVGKEDDKERRFAKKLVGKKQNAKGRGDERGERGERERQREREHCRLPSFEMPLQKGKEGDNNTGAKKRRRPTPTSFSSSPKDRLYTCRKEREREIRHLLRKKRACAHTQTSRATERGRP